MKTSPGKTVPVFRGIRWVVPGLVFTVLLAGQPPVASVQAASWVGVSYRLDYGTFLGGKGSEQAREVRVLPDGSVLVGAQTCSTNMPVSPGAFQPGYAGDDPTLGHPGIYGGDCYLIRLTPDGHQIRAASYFGGSRQERNVYGLDLDSRGNIIITTATRSPDAPVTPGCFQPGYGGGPSDMLVAKVTPDLSRILWCTYVGGVGDDFPRGGLAVAPDDTVIVVGTTTSTDFPVTRGVVQRHLRGPRDSAIIKLKGDGTGVVFGTFLGGTGEDDAIMGVRLDAAGNLHLAGHTKSTDFPVTPGAAQATPGGASDCYLALLSPNTDRILRATYLGGSGNEFAEHRPWLMADGSLLLAGFCGSADFPTSSGAFQPGRNGPGDGFLVRWAADGKRFVFATLLGGSGGENWLMPTVDARGRIYVVGNSSSRDFPVTAEAVQRTYGGGANDGAMAVFSADGSQLLYATYLGGSGDEMIRSLTLGPTGDVWLVGSTTSQDFPVTDDALQRRYGGGGDAFIVHLAIQ